MSIKIINKSWTFRFTNHRIIEDVIREGSRLRSRSMESCYSLMSHIENVHRFTLHGQSYRPGWATDQTAVEPDTSGVRIAIVMLISINYYLLRLPGPFNEKLRWAAEPLVQYPKETTTKQTLLLRNLPFPYHKHSPNLFTVGMVTPNGLSM